ncbi:classical arabinogalactan protein 1-like [Vicia villosa]|uniref:classical arabinogalactan protein 1-like n=1 Tax=Vicia villosa TaxID=3911 RepID=UPI00273C1D7D|nr:classical arabinogalactan protein 1-like [Vicia villosa]
MASYSLVLMLVAALLVTFTVAQSPPVGTAPVPSPSTVVAPPSPSTPPPAVTPAPISKSPAKAPSPSKNNAALNGFTVAGSAAFVIFASAFVM